jgi:2-polyprenyl-6-methoxyphenol hydroxylase-like FAD-dependent oxidoreductase
MQHQSSFKVVIGGGGIAGLILANMLQLYGIDFVLLEADPGIVPEVGADITLLPHGNRILDQLDLYNKLLMLGSPVDSLYFQDDSGRSVCEIRGMNQSMRER